MEAIKATMVICQLCDVKPASLSTENEPESPIKFKFSFCISCFETGTIVVTIWRWKQLHPEYNHPKFKIEKEDSFNDIKEKYLKINKIELVNWKDY